MIGKRRLTRWAKRLGILAVAGLLGLIAWTAGQGVYWGYLADHADFAHRWQRTAEHQRHHIVDWLLHAEPRRRTTYVNTRLHGMPRDQVEAMLGKGQPSNDGYSYYLGSIEIEANPAYEKRDWLRIEFDANDRVILVETII